MSAPAQAPAASLTGAVGRFTVSPPGAARYDTTVQVAATALRTDPERIVELAEAGLPHRVDPQLGPLFDYDDVTNVGFFCGTGETTPELGLRFLMRFAASPASTWVAPKTWEVVVRPVPRIDSGSDRTLPRIGVRLPDLTAAGVEAVGEVETTTPSDSPVPSSFRLVTTLTGERQEIADPRVRPVWEGVLGALADRSVRYQTVPEKLRAEPERAWSMGIADCVVASRVLAGRLREQGLDARVRRGYLLGLFGSDHAWCELHEDGVAKPMDPIFAHFARVGDEAKAIARSPEFAEACYGSRFNRLLPCDSVDGAPLVYFDDEPAPYWAMVGVSARPWARP
jgi:transglutaminase-like putative cysteine protease